MKHKLPELLAPAGGREQLEAAVSNGADAVYMGGSLFNARIKADNFKGEDIKTAIDYAHEHGVKVYVTLNTLIKDSELAEAFEYVEYLYSMGADAIIVQDMGLIHLIRNHLPDMPMHLSTQGTIYNPQALDFVRDLGIRRVVLAREMTLEEMSKMTSGPVEIEVFVHGALCICYSGQCQMSRLLAAGKSGVETGRSGNRGLCAQPCRLEYSDDKGHKTFALSPKDICTVASIPELCEVGVDSFKIEGRLKSAEYVAVVTRIYRKYLDLYGEGRWPGEIDPWDAHELEQIFNRGGFTEGYLYGNPGEKLLSGTSPKNRGVYMGRVIAVREAPGADRGRKLADVRLEGRLPDGSLNKISLGDGVEMLETDNVVTYVKTLTGNTVRIGDFKGEVNVGDRLFKVTDKALLEKARESGHVRTALKMKFTAAVGSVPILSSDGVRISGEAPVEAAIKRPMDEGRIRQQLSKLGGTPFKVENAERDIDVVLEGDVMIPVSLLNNMRRQLVEKLLEVRRNASLEGRVLPAAGIGWPDEYGQKTEQWSFDRLVPLELFMAGKYNHEAKVLPYVLNVSKGNLDKYIEDNFDAVAEAVRDTGIALGNPGWIRQFQRAGIRVFGDYGLNIYNEQARKLFEEEGVTVIAMSDEASSDGRHVMLGDFVRVPAVMEQVPLMITENPLQSAYLTDRKGVRHNVYKWYSNDKYLIFR